MHAKQPVAQPLQLGYGASDALHGTTLAYGQLQQSGVTPQPHVNKQRRGAPPSCPGHLTLPLARDMANSNAFKTPHIRGSVQTVPSLYNNCT
eukprot:782763-Rhodomonas_salina.1